MIIQFILCVLFLGHSHSILFSSLYSLSFVLIVDACRVLVVERGDVKIHRRWKFKPVSTW